MPTIHLEAQVSRRELLRAAAGLTPPELEQFATEVVALRDQRAGRPTILSEDELIQLVRTAYSEDLRQRYHELNAKRRDGSMTSEEHSEFLRLTDEVENRTADRVWALGQLALRRNQTLEAIMHDLGITPPACDE